LGKQGFNSNQRILFIMDAFSTLAEFRSFMADLPEADLVAKSAATERNSQLTKPAGALGDLENLAIWYASWTGNGRPSLEAPQVVIFAGNHGVVAAGVSAFPPEVTQQMVYNFQAGGAAINQLCKATNSGFYQSPGDERG
jgi:nicotinate-nucleotide--dimethylbenzimidazole phosphoribosyltransferase